MFIRNCITFIGSGADIVTVDSIHPSTKNMINLKCERTWSINSNVKQYSFTMPYTDLYSYAFFITMH